MTGVAFHAGKTPPSDGGIAFYAAAGALMAAFVPGIAVWRQMQETLGGSAAAVPIAAAVLFAAGLLVAGHRRRSEAKWVWVAAGVLLAGITFFLTDPDFPAKRIHVAQYMVLAVVLRRAVAPHASGWSQWGLATLLGAVLGVHDEMIQGLHPDRTFGVRDIAVNALSAAAGGLIAHGLGLWRGTAKPVGPGRFAVSGAAAVFVGTVLLIAVLPSFRDMVTPVWSLAPLFAGGTIWSLACGGWSGRRGDPLSMAVWWCLFLPLYPWGGHVVPLVFH